MRNTYKKSKLRGSASCESHIKRASCGGEQDLVGPLSTEFWNPGNPNTRDVRPQGGWRLSVSGEATTPRPQGVARLRPASPCGRERDVVIERGVRPQRSGGRALQVPSRAPGTLAIRPLGWRLLPPFTGRHRTLDGEHSRRGGPNMRP